METAVLWFRRDLRLHDHPALAAAAEVGGVVPLAVLDPVLLESAGPVRLGFYLRTLRALDDDLRDHGAHLVVRIGRPEEVVPAVVAEAGAGSVHISSDHGPYGRARDERVRAALGEVPLVAAGSAYAVTPGRLRTKDARPYQVFTPFYRAWLEHGWRSPATGDPAEVAWRTLPSEDLPDEPDAIELPDAGEAAALRAWSAFRERADYGKVRDRPDLDATSRMSPHLRFGAIHPRTLLADLGPDDDTLRSELAWREFFAAALDAWPATAREYHQAGLAKLPYAIGGERDRRFAAWCAGETGYPLLDAGMRQLLTEGWMHNRVRMLVASFLVKDLRIEWTWGARHFMRHLIDGDLASNQLNWQWAAGSGFDAAPYFRIFNPVTQSRRFDPDGSYIRRWVPELRGVHGRLVHEPWRLPDGPPESYPEPIVDHDAERRRALADYRMLRGGS